MRYYTVAICPYCENRLERPPFELGATMYCIRCDNFFTADVEVKEEPPKPPTERDTVLGAALFGGLFGGFCGALVASFTGLLIGAIAVGSVAAFLAYVTFQPEDH